MLKHTRNLLLCGLKIESRTKLYMSYLGLNESEAFLQAVNIEAITSFPTMFSELTYYKKVTGTFNNHSITIHNWLNC